MGWETRDNRAYYYRKQRIGDKVVSEYVGTGLIAEFVAEHDSEQRQQRQATAEAFRAECKANKTIDSELDAVCDAVRSATAAALLLTGHHTHKRQWRKQRV